MVVAVANQTNQANQIEAKDFKAIFAAEIADGKKHTIAIDAEWDSKIKLTLGYALVVESKYKFVVLNEAIRNNSIKDKKGKKLEIPEEIIERIEKHCQANDYILHWMPLNDDSCDATSAILREYGVHKASFDVLMYYSPKDLNISFGFENIKPFYNKKKITQKKRLSGTYVNTDTEAQNKTKTKTKTKKELKYCICDLKGWSNTSLKDFAASVGVEMTAKDKMDDYKACMLDGLIAEPETFLDYMVGDTTCLFEIKDNFTQNIQWLQRDVIKLPKDKVYEDDKIPLTIGSIVAGTLEKYIRFRASSVERQDEYNYALLKLGIIKEKARNKDEIIALHNDLRQKIKDSQTFEENWLEVESLINDHWSQYQFTAYSQCSVNYFGRETRTNEGYLALVQGGRCNNEQYWRYRLDYAADIDLKSAYASVLRKIEYPIGLPTITSFTPNGSRWNLKKWFEHTKVLDGTNPNWMVVVRGNLSFSQDLLFSKVTDQGKINEAIVNDNEGWENHNQNDDAHIEGQFILARRELKNVVITSDIWETILKIASTKELKELRGLQVVAGAYYRDEDRCADVNEWIDKVLACDVEYVTDKSTGRITDKRTRAWFSVSLEDVFGKIIDTRNQLKSEAKQANARGNHEDYLKLNGKQEALKLFVNTGYGVLASPYFQIGNTVVANNITAQIRLAVWQMNKALNTCQSITDGGLYEPNKVNKIHPKGKKPSLETLSDLRKLQEHRSVGVVSLGGGDVDWVMLIESLFENELTPEDEAIFKNHDALALEHIKNFWAVYELDFHFNVEHKTDNYARRVAYWSKADYALDRVNGERHYKIRGAKKNANRKNHPKFELFDNILAGDDTFPEDTRYTFSTLLKVGKYKTIQDSNGYENYKDLQPGDEYEEERTAQFNNTHIPVDEIKVYEKRARRTKNEDKKLFEKHAPEGIGGVHRVMLKDTLLFSVKPKSD